MKLERLCSTQCGTLKTSHIFAWRALAFALVFVLATFPMRPTAVFAGTVHAKKLSDATMQDLIAAQDLITEVHPGALPDVDPVFFRHLRAGFGAAQQLALQLPAEDQALAALNAYTASFSDNHLRVAWPAVPTMTPTWAGWNVAPAGHTFVVRDTALDWKAPLPPVGSQLTHCDGQGVDAFIQARIAPYVDRRYALEGTRHRLGILLTNRISSLPMPLSSVPSECTFRTADGLSATLNLTWAHTDEGLRRQAYMRPSPGLERWKSGYWVYVNDFDPHSPNRRLVEEVVRDVGMLSADAAYVVLDTRGHRGGTGIVGYELLGALMKSGTPNDDADVSAKWRVSEKLVDALRRELPIERAAAGADSSRFVVLSSILARMEEAQREGIALINDESGAVLPSPPAGASFKGRVVLVTDSDCASACLDFVDMVRRIPNALHVGRETSADTNYLEVGKFALPSGTSLYVPTKAWLGRKRGVNEPVVPDAEFTGDIRDSIKLREWLASILRSR